GLLRASTSDLGWAIQTHFRNRVNGYISTCRPGKVRQQWVHGSRTVVIPFWERTYTVARLALQWVHLAVVGKKRGIFLQFEYFAVIILARRATVETAKKTRSASRAKFLQLTRQILGDVPTKEIISRL